MTQPSMPNGQREAAMAQIGTALDLMEQMLPKLGVETEEGQAVLDALKTLTRAFGKSRSNTQTLQPAALMMMMRGLKGAQ